MLESPDASDQDAELRAHVQRALATTYEVDQEIGRGGMGIVYRAKDKRLKRYVAIKLLPPELSFRRDVKSRFKREAETAAQLSHPNIVPIYSIDEVENLVFFVMACVDGDNLATRLKNRGPLPIDEVRRVLTEVAEALAYAHQRGVIHRDIKPDNILMDSVDGRALVTDFGIARAGGGDGDAARLTATGIAIGTPAYMSPEQASGERDVDGRSDLYSLGVVAYQMLVGEPPFIGTTTPVLLVKHLAETPVPVQDRRTDIPPDLAQIVMRLLQKQPEHRFPGAVELVQALKSGLLPTPPAGTPALAAPGTARNAWSPPSFAVPGAQTTNSWSPNPAAAMPLTTQQRRNDVANVDDSAAYQPTVEDRDRWNALPVQKFRKKLKTFLIVNAVFIPLAIVSDKDLLTVTTFWSIYLAFKYAKLWTGTDQHPEGYDWRDVLHQPKHRLLGDVVSDVSDNTVAIFSQQHRKKLKEEGRLGNRFGITLTQPASVRGVLPNASSTRPSSAPGKNATASNKSFVVTDDVLGEFAPLVARARYDRDEIVRIVGYLPPAERARVPDVAGTANTLVGKIEAIAMSIARSTRDTGARSSAEIDAEVTQLESEANPFDTARSEARVRRLAQLRRERRMVIDTSRHTEEQRARLESCRLALENVRLDLVRLRAGNSSVQSVTLVAEQAMALAAEVDLAVAAASEVRDLTKSRPSKSSA